MTAEEATDVDLAEEVRAEFEVRPAAWMFVSATAKSLHYFPAKRGRSMCGRYFRNGPFEEAGLWWPETGTTPDDCWTCRDRLTAWQDRTGANT